jgi:hypothetical protein
MGLYDASGRLFGDEGRSAREKPCVRVAGAVSQLVIILGARRCGPLHLGAYAYAYACQAS